MAEETVSVLDYNLDEVPEMGIADEGESNLTFTKVIQEPWNADERKKDNPDPDCQMRIVFHFGFTDLEDVWPIKHYVRLPHDSEPDETKKRLRRLKDVYQAVGIPTDGSVNSVEVIQEYYGTTFFASIKVNPETTDWGANNSIKRFMSGQSG